MTELLELNLTYDIKTGEFDITGNLKKEGQISLIGEFLREQTGNGADNRESNDLDKYHINLQHNLENGDIAVESDTGNDGLREGILMTVLERL